jgi:23S rRNA pseudouridine2605 synthase
MEHDTENGSLRLQKALADAGVASRRSCEQLIAEGRVSVNGRVVREPGTKVVPQTDILCVDGERINTATPARPVYIMLNKPVGVTSTVRDPRAKRTVLDLVSEVNARLYPVGRLDADSSGLLLLTNDGEFANRMTHPRYHVPKVYRIRARGFVDRQTAIRLSEGIDLADGKTAPADLRFVAYDAATQTTVLDMTLYEGRNRQARRMLEAVGHPVRELTRIGFGPLRLKGLAPGTWRKLRPDEVTALLAQAQPTPTPPRAARRPRKG